MSRRESQHRSSRERPGSAAAQARDGTGTPVRTVRANDAWEALLSAHAVLIKRFGAEDIWVDVSMREYDVLYTLAKCPEPLRLGELNRHVLLSQPALSRLVDRLAERGLVEREPDPADRRGVRLSLTGAGREVQRRIGRRHARGVTEALTAALSPAEIRQLEAICGKLAGQPGRPGKGTTRINEDMLR